MRLIPSPLAADSHIHQRARRPTGRVLSHAARAEHRICLFCLHEVCSSPHTTSAEADISRECSVPTASSSILRAEGDMYLQAEKACDGHPVSRRACDNGP